MCEISELLVMVVEPDPVALQQTCDALNRIGILNIVCVQTYKDSVQALESNSDIDIILADYNMEGDDNYGILLCSYLKKHRPGVLFILTSKEYTCSVIMNSIKMGAEDILDLRRENEVENLMEKWLVLAKEKHKFKELLHGKRPQ